MNTGLRMDTETAIKEIKDRIELELAYRCDADLAPEYIGALEMAIEALERQMSMKPAHSANKITIDVQLRPLLDDLEVDLDDIKEYISKLKENEQGRRNEYEKI
jgi:tRNA(Ser,Leu) C12 N-acetylase TAN1